ncbi:Bax inhibitor-1/YccA family protein [Pseudohongiella sp.]|uniref:TEGT family carrier/transport protein n=1 Tax=marine sediment metagenome TaxID=412755 RepID=A0A0F9Z0G3_9ZZZZ|nr:Bax inhibitor-1/YccA family protein [Pseudohongiella sp.]HDZ09796.1 Bax inhibitor-1/YccA family protein [Pseudohongiella sp.]HEA61590.1 Bax inhibitor-1/YccA family protein [Pseudohongiella sp.]
MSQYQVNATRTGESAVVVNKVLKNTYLLLALTLAFSALTASLAMASNAAPVNIFVMLIGFYGLLFATHKLANSAWGLLAVFALTGFMGYTLGPILSYYMATSNGSQLVMTALGGTAFIFFGLSGYALVSRKDFSFLSGFMMAGFLVIVAAFIANLFLQIPALQLALSAAFMLFSSAAILMQTGAIINGGERNYILATVTLYVSLYNIFISLLNLLTAFGGEE